MADLFDGISPARCEAQMPEVALGVVYCRSYRAVLMLRREDLGNEIAWVFPGGKIDPKLDYDGGRCVAARAAIREVREETGVHVDARTAKRIACREHPITNALIHYFLIESNGIGATNREPTKHISVDWLAPEDVLARLGDRLATPVAKQLMQLSARSH